MPTDAKLRQYLSEQFLVEMCKQLGNVVEGAVPFSSFHLGVIVAASSLDDFKDTYNICPHGSGNVLTSKRINSQVVIGSPSKKRP